MSDRRIRGLSLPGRRATALGAVLVGLLLILGARDAPRPGWIRVPRQSYPAGRSHHDDLHHIGSAERRAGREDRGFCSLGPRGTWSNRLADGIDAQVEAIGAEAHRARKGRATVWSHLTGRDLR